jgi:hypothetical protein
MDRDPYTEITFGEVRCLFAMAHNPLCFQTLPIPQFWMLTLLAGRYDFFIVRRCAALRSSGRLDSRLAGSGSGGWCEIQVSRALVRVQLRALARVCGTTWPTSDFRISAARTLLGSASGRSFCRIRSSRNHAGREGVFAMASRGARARRQKRLESIGPRPVSEGGAA